MTMTRRQAITWGAVAAAAVATPALTSCRSGADAVPSPTPSSVPSPADTGHATDAEQIASIALAAAQQGAASGSYGIGGALVDAESGVVLKTMSNHVFAWLSADVQETAGKTFVQDPTAHGERQLSSWYFANRDLLGLPSPEKLTVVTTVDPCLMCTGSLLTAGFNVGVVAPDTFSGINYDLKGDFLDLPGDLRGQAQARFGYYAVQGGRPYQGGSGTAFADTTLTAQTYAACGDLYTSSANDVRAARRADSVSPSQMKDPGTDSAAAPIRDAFGVVYPEAFTVKVANPRQPGDTVRRALENAVARSKGSTNAVGFIDPFGNLVTVAADQPFLNPLNTAFALCSRQYAQTRWLLVNSKSTCALAQSTLTNPPFGTFVWLTAPDPFTSVGMFDYGAYGSTMGAQATPFVPSAFQYYETPDNVTELDLQNVVYPLPPLYSQGIKISPQRVVSA